jgi:ribosomal protein L11 methylase PrmA
MALVQMPGGGRLLSRLDAWGYQAKTAAPLASIVGGLDVNSLALLERLADDLMHMKDTAHNSWCKVTVLQEELKVQGLKLMQVVKENESLLETISQLTKEINQLRRLSKGVRSKEASTEDQVKQWRAQSIHQLEARHNLFLEHKYARLKKMLQHCVQINILSVTSLPVECKH